MTENKQPVDLSRLAQHDENTPTVGAAAEDYLWMKHTIKQAETHEFYRKPIPQRILSGKSVPLAIIDVNTDTDNGPTVEVTGRLRYEDIFDQNADRVKQAYRIKEPSGNTSGSWMVANRLDPGRTDENAAEPTEIESGVQATVKTLDLSTDHIKIELQNQYRGPGESGRFHTNWTVKETKAIDDDRYLHITAGGYLILDPQTDDITADRAQKALETHLKNHINQLFEDIRLENIEVPATDAFVVEQLKEYADWISNSVSR